MKSLMTKIFVLFCLLPTAGFAVNGNEGSGGGDTDGLMAAIVARRVVMIVERLGDSFLTSEQRERLQQIQTRQKIVMVESARPVQVNGLTQLSTAYSKQIENDIVTELFRDGWRALQTELDQEAFMLHELLVLASIEASGDYHLSSRYRELNPHSNAVEPFKRTMCVISLIEKTNSVPYVVLEDGTILFNLSYDEGRPAPGEVVASTQAQAVEGVRTHFRQLLSLPNERAIFVSIVLGSSGYLRASVWEGNARHNTEDDQNVFIDNQVTYDPYLFPGNFDQSPKLISLENHYLMISCASSR